MQTMAASFVLLFSTLGYELNATKRVLLRAVTPVPTNVVNAAHSTWRLTDAHGADRARGHLKRLDDTYGIQLWEIDFSSVRREGTYKVVVHLHDGQGEIVGDIETLPFQITHRLHFKRTGLAVSIENAEARAAPKKDGGGYYDCDSTMGEAYSHGVFLAGLATAYRHWQSDLDETQKQRLASAVNRAVDYLLLLHNAKTGEIRHEHPSRPHQNLNRGRHNTVQGLYGLAVYCHLFKEIDPAKTRTVFDRALQSLAYLEGRNEIDQASRATILCHLHGYAGDEAYRAKAVEALEAYMASFQWPVSYYSSRLPSFEGLHLAWRMFRTHARRDQWIQWAKELDRAHLQPMLKENGFHVFFMPSRLKKWQSGLPPRKLPKSKKTWAGVCGFADLASDAIMLAQVTGDHSLEKLASGALGWITGINPGVAGRFAVNPGSDAPLACAALIAGLDARHVAPWHRQWKSRNNRWMSLINGPAVQDGRWVYENDWFTAETFIQHDGAYLNAICLYEDYLADVK